MSSLDHDSMKFLLVGNGPYENRGCEAIVRGTVEAMSRRFPGARFILSSFGEAAVTDAASESDHRIEHRPATVRGRRLTDPRWWLYKTLLRPFPALTHLYSYRTQRDALREAACALSIGGDNYTLDYGFPHQFLHMDEALMGVRKPVAIWGASVGPFSQDPEAERVMREHLKRLSMVLVRESESLNYLASIGVTGNVRLVGDPAFLMRPTEPALDDELLRFLDQGPVGLNFSPLAGRYSGDADGWLDLTRRCIDALVKSCDRPILLIPHVCQAGNDDYEFMMRAAGELIDKDDRLRILPPALSAAEYKWVISKLRVFAGARTHATIAALSTGVPTISLGYSMKARGLNADIYGCLDWLIDVRALSPEALPAKIENALAEEDAIRSRLADSIPAMEAKALSAADHLAELLAPAAGH